MQAPLFRAAEAAATVGGVVRIALPVPIDSLFDYRVPEALAEHARPGHRALVPFSGRKLTGLIVETVADASPTDEHSSQQSSQHPDQQQDHQPSQHPGKLAAIERIVDDEPVVSVGMITLLREAARDFLCPVGLALNHALPPGASPRVVHHLGLTARGRTALEGGAVSGVAATALAALTGGPLTPATLARRVPGDAPPPLRDLLADGLLEKVNVEKSASVREASVRIATVAPDVDPVEVCENALGRAPRQAELLRRIAREGELPTRTLTSESTGNAGILRTLERRGFIRLVSRAAPRNVLGADIERDTALSLTPEQAAALEQISHAIEAGQASTLLLHGVTGSGKTEVYLRAIAHALARGQQALVLVPEITLTHQIVARLRARFGDELAVLHSGLRPSERLEQWQRLRRGDVPIAVGARSALFAPIERLGVIVVDEEHDGAYKNEEGFRYHARELAGRRAELASCPLILGSATPSLETRYAADKGEITRLVLARRIGGRPLPAVTIVDLEAERKKAPRGRKLILSRPLRQAMRETLDAGGQTILFLNRRGFSTSIYCFDCGVSERCSECDVALVYHATSHQLRCHYCDFAKPPPDRCGGCGAPDTALLGIGTERVEEDVRSFFPEARLARLDRDTAQRRGHTEAVLAALTARDVDILIGTQMVAKGHDFPGVQLVGVIAADLGLHMPDFRAAERTFQVLTQVAGRAGRASEPGRVILQTFVPEHYAIAPVSAHDFESFYAHELSQRAALHYPPFAKLCQIVVSGADEEETRAGAEQLATVGRARAAEDTPAGAQPTVELLGPAPSPLARLRGRYRYQLLIKGAEPVALERVVEELVARIAALPRALRASIDMSPGSML